MFYLAMWLSGGMAIIPEKYIDKAACDAAGKSAKYLYYDCIPAPEQKMISALPMNSNCITITTNPPKLECK